MDHISTSKEDAPLLFPRDGEAYFTENAFGLALLEGIIPRLHVKDQWDKEVDLIKQVQTDMLAR